MREEGGGNGGQRGGGLGELELAEEVCHTVNDRRIPTVKQIQIDAVSVMTCLCGVLIRRIMVYKSGKEGGSSTERYGDFYRTCSLRNV